MDAEIGRLFEALRSDGAWNDTLVIVVGDHGEALGEHDEVGHGAFLYESSLRVPFLLRYPDGRRAGERPTGLVSVVDVHPTLVEAMGLPAPKMVDGVSLLHAAPALDRGVYFESYYGYLSYGWSPLSGWLDAEGKYIHSSAPQFFDVAGDPGETEDLAGARSEELSRYAAAIGEVAGAPALENPGFVGLDEGLLESIRSLGYAAGGTGETLPHPLDTAGRPSPQSRADVHDRMVEASRMTAAALRRSAVGADARTHPHPRPAPGRRERKRTHGDAMNRSSLILASVALGMGLAGCATSPADGASSGMGRMPGMDRTVGPLTHAATDDLLIVLMNPEFHGRLTQGKSVAREDRLPPRYANYLVDLSGRFGLQRVADWSLDSIGVHCLVFRADPLRQRAELVQQLASHPGVEHVQPLQYFEALSSSTGYNDPYLPMQHNLAPLQIPQSHRFATGAGVRVAVIDTGLDHNHPELSRRVTVRRNFVDRDMQSFARDQHGTAVAGVIAAGRNNGTGMVGIAPEAELFALKSCWQNPAGRTTCSSFTLAKALNFAIKAGADVINLSLGGPKDPLLARLVDTAVANGISVVGAVHPKMPDGFPAGLQSVIAVGGPATATSSDVIVAPSDKILATVPDDGYEFQSGTSFAAAQVSGIVALVKQRKPHIAPAVVKTLLHATSDGGNVRGCQALARYVLGAECN